MEEEIPVVDISKWIGAEVKGTGESDHAALEEDCRRMADALHRFGIVLVRDPRVSDVDNNAFLDKMEAYYAQSDGVKDARPEVCTPHMCNKPRKYQPSLGSSEHKLTLFPRTATAAVVVLFVCVSHTLLNRCGNSVDLLLVFHCATLLRLPCDDACVLLRSWGVFFRFSLGATLLSEQYRRLAVPRKIQFTTLNNVAVLLFFNNMEAIVGFCFYAFIFKTYVRLVKQGSLVI